MHGYVESLFEDDILMRGTGTLISDRNFLTAAHCLRYMDRKGRVFLPKRVTFYADLGDQKISIKANSKAIYIHPAYLENDMNFDFSLVGLEADIGSYTGWSSLRVLSDVQLDGKPVNVTGYPAQKTVWDILLGRHTERLYTMEGPIVASEKHRIFYDIDTSGGQSGSGVWYMDEEDLVSCVGVHTMGRSRVVGNARLS